MEETRQERRKREDLQERYEVKRLFEACQKLAISEFGDDSLVLQVEKGAIFLTKFVGKDSVSACLVHRGMGKFGFGGNGWAAIEFSTNIYDVDPKNWYRLNAEAGVTQATRDRQAKLLPKKVVKVLQDVAQSIQNYRANEVLKKLADENKIERVRKALGGVAEVKQGYGRRAEVALDHGGHIRVEEAYDGNFNVWAGSPISIDQEGLVKLIRVLDKHLQR